MSTPEEVTQESSQRPSAFIWLALLASLAALGGSLYLSLGMNLRACPLCFYQRTFAMSLIAILIVGLGLRTSGLTFLAFPLATGGLGVACFHVYLELTGKLECPAGILGFGSAPQQSLAVFAVVIVLLLSDGVKGRSRRPFALVGGLVLGGLLAAASCIANPPPAPSPTPDICRPPVRATPQSEPSP